MRFLADAGLSPRTIAFLRDLGHDAIHVRDLGLERAEDTIIIDIARTTERVLLAFDLDFGQLLAAGALDRPSVVLFRLADERVKSVNARLGEVVSEYEATLEAGALILIEDTRVRVRRLPIGVSLKDSKER